MSLRRQQKINSLLQEALSEIFQKYGAYYYGKAFVTITEVAVTADLLTAKVYLSIWNVTDKEKSLDEIKAQGHEIRKHLGNKMRHHLRRIPELLFYLDESLENALRVNELLKQIAEGGKKK
ncbi:MAG TPA: 30S ribosome-binding factor RbfA [Chitinophagales bacterium]|nr:30S ribosome-binding factor RbfA [Chitinophagales bacterium]